MERKIVRSMFKKQAKMKIDDWIIYAEELIPELEKLKEGDKSIISIFPELKENLKNLIEFHEKTAKLVEKFVQGEELETSLEGLQFAQNKIGQFLELLEKIEKETN